MCGGGGNNKQTNPGVTTAELVQQQQHPRQCSICSSTAGSAHRTAVHNGPLLAQQGRLLHHIT
jgi:hypothetical protein